MSHLQTTRAPDYSEAEREQIIGQVNRLCESPRFSSSRRYPELLRYVVVQTLAGRSDQIKERTLGIEVFHRSADYDSSADPTVRIAASEVRKRLAQYYYEPGRERELRIELPVGSYVPSFIFPDSEPTGHATSWPEQIVPPPTTSVRRPLRAGIFLAAVAVLIAVFVLFAIRQRTSLPNDRKVSTSGVLPESPATLRFDQFWQQIVSSSGQVQLCMGLWTDTDPNGPGSAAGVSDFKGMARIEDMLERRQKRIMPIVRMIGPGPTKFLGFLDGPVIYVGAPAPLASIMGSWRFRLETNARDRRFWIRDHDSTYDKRWHTEIIPLNQRGESYAIVTRIIAGRFNLPMLFVTGTDSTTRAGAVEMLTDARNADALFGNAPAHWEDMNYQAVIESRPEAADHISAKVLVTQFWK